MQLFTWKQEVNTVKQKRANLPACKTKLAIWLKVEFIFEK